MFEKRRYSILWIYKGGHEAYPGCETGWSRAEALEKARVNAQSMQVQPADVQILCDLGVVATHLTHGEAAAQHNISIGKGIR